MDSVPYSELIPTTYLPDERQDACLALLEGKPSTEQAARSLINRCHWKAEYHSRQRKRRAIQFLFEPVPTEQPMDALQVTLWAAIDLLEKGDAELIRLRFDYGYSITDLSKHYKVSRATIDRRIERIITYLKEISQNV
jgi:DNA-directed RNA polymerase specialized sigma24 family protein